MKLQVQHYYMQHRADLGKKVESHLSGYFKPQPLDTHHKWSHHMASPPLQ